MACPIQTQPLLMDFWMIGSNFNKYYQECQKIGPLFISTILGGSPSRDDFHGSSGISGVLSWLLYILISNQIQ